MTHVVKVIAVAFLGIGIMACSSAVNGNSLTSDSNSVRAGVLNSIIAESNPDSFAFGKTWYIKYLTVKAIYANGTSQDISVGNVTITDTETGGSAAASYSFSAAKIKIFIGAYKGKTANFTLTWSDNTGSGGSSSTGGGITILPPFYY
jgi:hypothetical protein